MAPAFLGFAFSSTSPAQSAGPLTIKEAEDPCDSEALKLNNMQLQKVLEESQRRETALQAELEEMKTRLSKAEEAEERLCSQLGDLEAESVYQARDFVEELNSLKQKLVQTETLLKAAQR